MFRFVFAFLSATFFLAHVACAEKFDTHRIFAKGSWSVDLTKNLQQGNVWCNASTVNDRQQTFGITGYESGALALFIFDSHWQLRKRQVHFRIDIDYDKWSINGSASGIGVSLLFTDPQKAKRFIGELETGTAVAVYNDSQSLLATFSLSGSSAALNTLMQCWSLIGKSDGQAGSADPFGSSTDPFN